VLVAQDCNSNYSGGQRFEASLGKQFLRPSFQNINTKMPAGMAPSFLKGGRPLNSNPSITKKKKKRKEKRRHGSAVLNRFWIFFSCENLILGHMKDYTSVLVY
jgi:hypothetical protein